MTPYRVEPFGKEVPRDGFDCEEDSLNQYFVTQVRQDQQRRIAMCYVAIEAATGIVAGYYTLASHTVALEALPPEVTKKLPKYGQVPAVLLGRLAVDKRYKRQGLGAALMMDAGQRVIDSGVAAWALLVDPLNAAADAFYRAFGFMPLQVGEGRLFLPMATIAAALKGRRRESDLR